MNCHTLAGGLPRSLDQGYTVPSAIRNPGESGRDSVLRVLRDEYNVCVPSDRLKSSWAGSSVKDGEWQIQDYTLILTKDEAERLGNTDSDKYTWWNQS